MAKDENYTAKFRIDVSDLKKGIEEANKQIKLANAEFKNATAGMDDWRVRTVFRQKSNSSNQLLKLKSRSLSY